MTFYRMLLMLSLITLFIPAFSMKNDNKQNQTLRRRCFNAEAKESVDSTMFGGIMATHTFLWGVVAFNHACSSSTTCMKFIRENPDYLAPGGYYTEMAGKVCLFSCIAAGCCIGFCCRNKPQKVNLAKKKD